MSRILWIKLLHQQCQARGREDISGDQYEQAFYDSFQHSNHIGQARDFYGLDKRKMASQRLSAHEPDDQAPPNRDEDRCKNRRCECANLAEHRGIFSSLLSRPFRFVAGKMTLFELLLDTFLSKLGHLVLQGRLRKD